MKWGERRVDLVDRVDAAGGYADGMDRQGVRRGRMGRRGRRGSSESIQSRESRESRHGNDPAKQEVSQKYFSRFDGTESRGLPVGIAIPTYRCSRPGHTKT